MDQNKNDDIITTNEEAVKIINEKSPNKNLINKINKDTNNNILLGLKRKDDNE